MFKDDLLSPLTQSATNFKYLWQETYTLKSASLSSLLYVLINTQEKDRHHYTNSGLPLQCGYFVQHSLFYNQEKKNCHIEQNKKNIDETKKKDCAKDDEKGSLEKANQ